MKAYIDTSAIISAYKPDERSYRASLRIASLNSITKVGSFILMTELFSVTSRLYKTSQIKVSASVEKALSKLPAEERIYALVNTIVLDWNLQCPSIGLEVKEMRLKSLALSMPEAMLEACIIAPLVNLKTLDTIHIACAKIIREAAQDLEYFVTLDQDILNNREEIEKLTALQPITPQELADLL